MVEKRGENLLIIFTKNPVPGKVKTRLARDIGNQKALEVFLELLANTRMATESTKFEKAVFYAGQIRQKDLWEAHEYQKFLQQGKNIGERMRNAIKLGLMLGYKKVCLIGSDIYGLNRTILERAFSELNQSDLVYGPANDGGYYLVGTKNDHPELFDEIPWSSDQTLSETLVKADSSKLKCSFLPELIDVDSLKDLQQTSLLNSFNEQ